MANIFFISDTHFNHENIIKYSNRPFSNALEMNEKIIENWNSTVANSDTIYHLGDFGFPSNNKSNILNRLNGNKILVLGNHDRQVSRGWSNTNNYMSIKIDDKTIILFHFPIESWDKKMYNSWHLHGHMHGVLPDDPNKLRLDVGIDATCKTKFAPISYEEIRDIMKLKSYMSKGDFENI